MHKHPAPNLPSKPFLRWAGGKSRLLPQLLRLLPAHGRLIEPFVGAGSVFLGTSYESYVLNDANPDLVAVWAALKWRPREFVERASAYFSSEHHSLDQYLRVRAEFNDCTDRFERAVRVPYLNRFGFNGLYRVNRKGTFNVSYGFPTSLPPLQCDRFEAAAAKLTRCHVLNGGFAAAIELAGVGDVVYCDPPYLCSSTGDSFTGYTQSRFGLDEHEQLLECCLQAVSRGATALISNHDTPEVRRLYRGWQIEPLLVRRSISASAQSRGGVHEVVAMLPRQELRLGKLPQIRR